MSELIHEHRTHIHTPEGIRYVARTMAVREADGTWEAWLEFEPVGGEGPVLETDRESSQSSRYAVEQWAAGLEAVYLEGAFTRAHIAAGD